MEHRVSSRDAAASLDELLDRVSSSGDTVIIERDGRPVGLLVPTGSPAPRPGVPRSAGGNGSPPSFRDLVDLIRSSAAPDDGWADGVEEASRFGNRPLPPESPWGS